jgi:agmatine/peptidylarginine deiminase
MPAYRATPAVSTDAITTPPVAPPRTMAEWEELEGLMVTWTSYPAILTEIVRAALQQTTVYIVCSDSMVVRNTLTVAAVPLNNLRFVVAPFNSVWARDYGPWTAYKADVDSAYLIDWIYNRPRPKDDTLSAVMARLLNYPLYTTTASPYDVVHTGGNFMADGMGTAFSSNLVLDENPSKTAMQLGGVMNAFMGINRYVLMTNLPYDGIHHIDMHMKLLDEETLLVGQFPTGISDGPQLEANLLYVLSTFQTPFGRPYRVVRIPMPPAQGTSSYAPAASYRTYTNSVIVNKTVIVPTYYAQYDTTALRIYREAMPGYSVVGVNVEGMINASGAIHCITKELGTRDPLYIAHRALRDTAAVAAIPVTATMRHRTGIASATLYWRTDTLQPYQSLPMTATGTVASGLWTANIPAQPSGTRVYYYVHAQSNSGKQQTRPMPAPQGYWTFKVLGGGTGITHGPIAHLSSVFPNPSRGITCIPVRSAEGGFARIEVMNAFGVMVSVPFDGRLPAGDSHHFFNSAMWPAGMYAVVLHGEGQVTTQRIVVR